MKYSYFVHLEKVYAKSITVKAKANQSAMDSKCRCNIVLK